MVGTRRRPRRAARRVAAEAGQALDAEREVELVRLSNLMLLLVGEDRVAELLGLHRRERRVFNGTSCRRCAAAAASPRGDVEIARALLDHRLEQLADRELQGFGMVLPCSHEASISRDAADLFDRGHAREDLVDAGSCAGCSCPADGLRLELGGRSALEHHLLERLVEAHDLVERHAALGSPSRCSSWHPAPFIPG
jgi:hypothetical protein